MKIIIILAICFCMIGAGSISSIATNSNHNSERAFFIIGNYEHFIQYENPQLIETVWDSNCNLESDWIFGARSGPQLWHITDKDAWTGDLSLGCFNEQSFCYENNMDLNYALANVTLDMRDVIDMKLDFYCKFITEDSDDHWGILLYDPELNQFLCHHWAASESWQRLPYETYGYHSIWMGPMQPLGEYQSFSIKSAYDHWYELGFFRYPNNGTRSYSVQVGFMVSKTDSSGYTNDEAEAHGEYWSGLFIDDVSIQELVINSPPDQPLMPSGPTEGYVQIAYSFVTHSTDSNGDKIRYGWDWNNDDIVDEWTSYYSSGETIQCSHIWNEPGNYQIKVIAEDEQGDRSDYSNLATISISDNLAPNSPDRPSGPDDGKTGISYTYETKTTDPNSDTIYYLFDWGDGNVSGWNGPYSSGQTVEMSYIWMEKGDYTIRVKAKDDPNGDGDPSDGLASEWSEPLSVTMPKTHIFQLFYLDPSMQLFINILKSYFSRSC